MRKNIILLISILLSASSFSQNNFLYLSATQNDERPTEICELPGGNFIISYSTRGTYDSPFNQMFVKINGQGTVLEELLIPSTEDMYLNNMIIINDSLIFCIGDALKYGYSQVWTFGIDTNLNILFDKRYQTSASQLMIRSFLDVSGNINSVVSKDLTSLQFYKFNIHGDTLFCWAKPEHAYMPAFDFFEHNGQYRYLGGFSLYAPTKNVLMDTLFNLISEEDIPLDLSNTISGKPSSSANYILAGRVMDDFGWNATIEKLNLQNEILNYNTIGADDSTLDYPATDNCIDFIDPDRIFLGNTSQVYFGCGGYYCPYYNHYNVTLFDSALTQTWSKTFGGDKYYIVRFIYATQDGGAILALSMYDYLNPDNKADVAILKVNSEGIVTKSSEVENPLSEVLVYPNPGNDYFQIKIPTKYPEAKIRLYQYDGKLTLSKSIGNSKTSISTSLLPKGFYIWHLESNGLIIDSGKWIKN